jgi:hypothetical protein
MMGLMVIAFWQFRIQGVAAVFCLGGGYRFLSLLWERSCAILCA